MHSDAMLDCNGRPLDLTRPQVMGILNVTPDSFSDGGRFLGRDQALAHAREMVEAGAAILDVGGESTRPGSESVPENEELDRVIPVVEALVAEFGLPVSVDTSKPAVMRAAVSAGAGLINDVYALRAPGALEAAAALGVPVCLMHMQGEPRTMQADPVYGDVVAEVRDFLMARVGASVAAGIPRGSILIDPGFGFGKKKAHNLALLRRLDELTALGLPLLVGLSRKSLIGQTLGHPVERRLAASLALAVYSVVKGARVVRVHDVAETVDAVRMIDAVMGA